MNGRAGAIFTAGMLAVVATVAGVASGHATAAASKTLKVGLVADQGELNDHGFNQLAYQGLQRAERELGVKGRVVESASWHERGDHLDFEITAASFLRHMVRTLVGTMLEREPEELSRLLRR